jgi:hypothetical protein
MILPLAVYLVSLIIGRDPLRLHVAMLRLGFDTRRADVREAIMARARL